jgi:hypothetical protein
VQYLLVPFCAVPTRSFLSSTYPFLSVQYLLVPFCAVPNSSFLCSTYSFLSVQYLLIPFCAVPTRSFLCSTYPFLSVQYLLVPFCAVPTHSFLYSTYPFLSVQYLPLPVLVPWSGLHKPRRKRVRVTVGHKEEVLQFRLVQPTYRKQSNVRAISNLMKQAIYEVGHLNDINSRVLLCMCQIAMEAKNIETRHWGLEASRR